MIIWVNDLLCSYPLNGLTSTFTISYQDMFVKPVHRKSGGVSYFGYGPTRDKEIISVITANKGVAGQHAILQGYNLCIQELCHVPDSVLSTSPIPMSPMKILETAWQANFKSYNLVKGKKDSKVAGMVWKLTPKEWDLIKEWELVKFGWSKVITTKALTKEGKKIDVVTTGIRRGQGFDKIVNGKKYKTFPVPIRDLKRAIRKCRKEYFERIMSESIR